MTLIKSLNTNYQKGFNKDGTKKIFCDKKINDSFYSTINQYKDVGKDYKEEPNLTPLQNLIIELEKKDINVILYTQPTHSTMYEIIKQNKSLNKIKIFKEKLANIHPYYDFYFPSEYSNELISPNMKYFFETSHCTYIVGEKILDKIFLNKGNYGEFINNSNRQFIHKNHIININKLKKWEELNPEWVITIHNIREGK